MTPVGALGHSHMELWVEEEPMRDRGGGIKKAGGNQDSGHPVSLVKKVQPRMGVVSSVQS